MLMKHYFNLDWLILKYFAETLIRNWTGFFFCVCEIVTGMQTEVKDRDIKVEGLCLSQCVYVYLQYIYRNQVSCYIDIIYKLHTIIYKLNQAQN